MKKDTSSSSKPKIHHRIAKKIHPGITHSVTSIFRKVLSPILFVGAFLLAVFFSVSLSIAIYDHQYAGKVYQGVKINNIPFSSYTKEEVRRYFLPKNEKLAQTIFQFEYDGKVATVSGEDLELGVDNNLLSEQAYSIGRTNNVLSDLAMKAQAYQGKINLPLAYSVNQEKLKEKLDAIASDITIEPQDAVFEMKGDRVVNFKVDSQGREVDTILATKAIMDLIPTLESSPTTTYKIPLSIKTATPKKTLAQANSYGIKEFIGEGVSHFEGSIANRIFNVALATSRVDGVIVKPGEVFSFNNVVGDISKLTGYKEAYVIQDGKTVLGDGGGVCQVSTTLFRAALNAGLPIVERRAHAYRVHYYEEDSGPGLDATVYNPSDDFKFKNDTPAAILIKAYVDTDSEVLTFQLYGVSDGRIAEVTKPVILNQTPPPDDLYQDDPTLTKGQVKQVDFKAWGANVTFSRTVTRNGQVLSQDKFDSNYRPWQAIYLRGTKEG